MAVPWGQARIEVAALRKEILSRVGDGDLIRKIYDDLRALGRVTMSRRQFYAHVRRLREEAACALSAVPVALPRAVAPLPPSAPPSSMQPGLPFQPPSSPTSVVTADLPQLKFQQSAAFKALWDGDDTPEPEAAP